MKPKNTFSKSAGFWQVIVLVVVMLVFTITSFALSGAARNEDGDGKVDRLEAREGITWREQEIDQSFHSNAELKYHEIISQCNFDDYRRIEFPFVRKGHWGVDKFMFDEIFRDETVKPGFHHAMDVRDGSMAVLIGIAARISIDEQRPVKIAELTDLVPQVNKLNKS